MCPCVMYTEWYGLVCVILFLLTECQVLVCELKSLTLGGLCYSVFLSLIQSGMSCSVLMCNLHLVTRISFCYCLSTLNDKGWSVFLCVTYIE